MNTGAPLSGSLGFLRVLRGGFRSSYGGFRLAASSRAIFFCLCGSECSVCVTVSVITILASPMMYCNSKRTTCFPSRGNTQKFQNRRKPEQKSMAGFPDAANCSNAAPAISRWIFGDASPAGSAANRYRQPRAFCQSDTPCKPKMLAGQRRAARR